MDFFCFVFRETIYRYDSNQETLLFFWRPWPKSEVQLIWKKKRKLKPMREIDRKTQSKITIGISLFKEISFFLMTEKSVKKIGGKIYCILQRFIYFFNDCYVSLKKQNVLINFICRYFFISSLSLYCIKCRIWSAQLLQ